MLILYAIVGACLMCLLAYFGVTQALGAHPRWAFDVALYGAVLGGALALSLSYITRFAVFLQYLIWLCRAQLCGGASGCLSWPARMMR